MSDHFDAYTAAVVSTFLEENYFEFGKCGNARI